MKRKVLVASLKEAASGIFPISGLTTLNEDKKGGLEMYTGVEAGFLTVYCQGKEVGVPIANLKGISWEENGNTVDRDSKAKA